MTCKKWKEGLIIEGIKIGIHDVYMIVTMHNNFGFEKLQVELGNMNARIGNEQRKVGDSEKWISGKKSKDDVKIAEGKRLRFVIGMV